VLAVGTSAEELIERLSIGVGRAIDPPMASAVMVPIAGILIDLYHFGPLPEPTALTHRAHERRGAKECSCIMTKPIIP
jgi:hypothetical protein